MTPIAAPPFRLVFDGLCFRIGSPVTIRLLRIEHNGDRELIMTWSASPDSRQFTWQSPFPLADIHIGPTAKKLVIEMEQEAP